MIKLEINFNKENFLFSKVCIICGKIFRFRRRKILVYSLVWYIENVMLIIVNMLFYVINIDRFVIFI